MGGGADMDERTHLLTVHIQGTEVRTRAIALGRTNENPSRPNDGQKSKRGVVSGLSDRSRRRLLSLMNHVLYEHREGALFLTLTYGSVWPSARQAKAHLRAFLKRLKRENSALSAIWRLEFQKRGAPHFHLMLFGVDFIPKEAVKAKWGEVVGRDYWGDNGDAPFTRIERMRSANGAAFYMSKYVAKAGGFNYVPYQAATGAGGGFWVDEGIGRLWGVEFKGDLPLAELIIRVVSVRDWHAVRDYLLNVFAGCDGEWGVKGVSRWLSRAAADWVGGIVAVRGRKCAPLH